MSDIRMEIHKIKESNVYGSAKDDPIAGGRVSPETLEEIDRVCKEDRLRSRSDFMREAIALRLAFRGENFIKLLRHAEEVEKLLKPMEMPMVLFRQ